MTRINVVPVKELSREHLIAEYREITRIPGNLKKSLNRKTKPFSMSEIPLQYTLGTLMIFQKNSKLRRKLILISSMHWRRIFLTN